MDARPRGGWAPPAPRPELDGDYFGNTYYPAQPFLLEAAGKQVWVRVVPVGFRPDDVPATPEGRDAKVRAAIAAGQARFRIEVTERANRAVELLGWDRDELMAGVGNPLRSLLAEEWIPLAELRLTGPLAIDQEALRYYPDLAGRGLRPVGVVASLRPAVYAASQAARPGTAEERERAESEGFLAPLQRD